MDVERHAIRRLAQIATDSVEFSKVLDCFRRRRWLPRGGSGRRAFLYHDVSGKRARQLNGGCIDLLETYVERLTGVGDHVFGSHDERVAEVEDIRPGPARE